MAARSHPARSPAVPWGSYTYGDSAHKHAATSIGTSTYTASYDASGNMTCRAPSGSQTCSGTPTGQALTYDNEGRTTAWQNAQSNPTSTEQMAYDGEGSRVALKVNGGTPTYYLGALEESTGSALTKYFTVADLPMAERVGTGGALSYLPTDGLGSVSEALDGSGNATFQQLYAPYGSVRYTSGTAPAAKAFTGQRADSASGLDYYGARYYDPSAGQFASADTVADGLNAYAYVHDNPETLSDPSGHDGGWGGFFSAVGSKLSSAGSAVAGAVQAAAPVVLNVASGVLDASTGIPSMIGDVQTLCDPHKSLMDKLLAGGDLVLNVGMDVSMVVGVGEAARGAYIAAKVASKVGEEVAVHVGEHVAEDMVAHSTEHIAEDAVTHAGEDAVEHAGECPLSFSPDTLVATPTGEQAIGTLAIGASVTAYDPSNGTTSTQTVQHVFINHDSDLLDVTLASDTSSSQPIAAAGASSKPQGAQGATVASQGRRALRQNGGERAAQRDGASAGSVSDSDQTKPLAETVHTTAKHPWLTADRGWVLAGDLQLGERVVREGGSTATIVALRVRPGVADYYNLTVSQLHTYAVGAGRYVVHNCKVGYGDTELSQKVKAKRLEANNGKGYWKNNYAAAKTKNGKLLFGLSDANSHAEGKILDQVEKGDQIVELYSEREPCATGPKCALQLQQHNPDMKISWTWNFNGVDEAGRREIGNEIHDIIRPGWR